MTINKDSAEIITLPEAEVYTHSFQETYPGETKAFFAGINKLKQVLEQDGCIGIRIYAGLDKTTNRKNLVLVGVDALGRDMVNGTLLEQLNPCPPNCDNNSVLIL
ncbi:MAG TPA: hypothetical protein VFL76_06475 [Edaphocola sp.]|nr:hypothetical protein [Edaphocola sp.]